MKCIQWDCSESPEICGRVRVKMDPVVLWSAKGGSQLHHLLKARDGNWFTRAGWGWEWTGMKLVKATKPWPQQPRRRALQLSLWAHKWHRVSSLGARVSKVQSLGCWQSGSKSLSYMYVVSFLSFMQPLEATLYGLQYTESSFLKCSNLYQR